MLAGCLVLLTAVAVRSVQLQVVDHAAYASEAAQEHRETITLHAARGPIVDVRGRPLALSEQATTIGAYVPLSDPRGVAQQVGALIGVDPGVLYQRLAVSVKGHVDIARQVDPVLAKRVEDAHVSPLLTFLPEEKRIYPSGVATQLVGATRVIDNVGITGLEQRYDAQLRGTDGSERFLQSGVGDTISPIDLVPPRDGARVELALDLSIQAATERIVESTRVTTRARHVLAIVLDPRTGGVLGMASTPGPGAADYHAATPEELRIGAISDMYEPGSTFKTATIAAGLDFGVITPRSRFVVPMCIRLYDRRICDAESHPTRSMTVADILRVSSNVGAIEIAGLMSGHGAGDRGKYFAPYLAKFGFTRATGIDLPGEEKGDVPAYSTWSGSTIGNIPFGQGLAVTPLQLASFYAMIANHGVWLRPHVVSRIGATAPAMPASRRMVSVRVARQLNSMLQGVVRGGTGVKAAVPGYTVAGKTGTTQKVVNGTYSDSHFIGWFVGYAPAKDPRVVTLVLVDDPRRGSYYGGDTAAPAFAALTARALQALAVPRGG